MIVCGIDPGLKGGISFIKDGVATATPLPLLGKELDIKQLSTLLSDTRPTIVLLEKVHSMPKQGVASNFKFGMGYGSIIGLLQGMRIPFQLVTPQAWKKVLSGTAKDKNAAIQYVSNKYPSVALIPKGKRVPHDGVADAVCIADYYFLMQSS